MNYETSPVSIKKRKPKKNESRSNSGVAISTTKDNSVTSSTSKDVAAENEKPSTTASKTPARRNSSLCESPQFLDVADSPEFRVGWDDGFETEKPGNKIKINETENGSKRKSKRKVLNARTLRTQRILSNTTQYNTTCQTEANDHPESDEFLAWAQSLLCGEPVVQEPLVESPKLNSSLNNTENQSFKTNGYENTQAAFVEPFEPK
uniref:Uncharacterized protein n=1 Tax=Cacopsylla melanoneura TaxID=428564 RepID=A0A8D9EZ43_9HEMI